jgi:hypothetical protein
MKSKYVYYAIVAVVIIGSLLYALKSDKESTQTGDGSAEDEKAQEIQKTSTTPAKTGTKTSTSGSKTTSTGTSESLTAKYPEMDFIDKRLFFNLAGFDNVKLTIEKIAFGRGDASMSTGCSGIPNANFSTYLYPGSGICISADKVDGAGRGIVAFHILVENNGNIGFGGNSNLIKLHYLRSGSGGEVAHRFAYPINGLASYYINGYSSRSIILSYLVPEDQLVYDLLVGYKEPSIEERSLDVYKFSSNGLLLNFGTKDIELVK